MILARSLGGNERAAGVGAADGRADADAADVGVATLVADGETVASEDFDSPLATAQTGAKRAANDAKIASATPSRAERTRPPPNERLTETTLLIP
jgi:hypothetical protein